MRLAPRWSVVAFLLLLLLGIALRVIGILHTSPTSVVNMPLPDDAFYYFTLARNVASGEGFVISGDGLPTTGFQPLWGFILSAAGWFLGTAPPTHLILISQILGALIGIATALLIFDLTIRITQHELVALFAFGVYLLSPQIVKHNLNGMETSLAFFALLLLLEMFLDFKLNQALPRQVFILGLTCGFAFLARVDLILFIAGAMIIIAISARPWASTQTLRGFFLRLALFGIGFLLAMVPWIWLGLSTGLGLIPESGEAVRNLTLMVRHMPLLSFPESIREAPELFVPYYFENAVEFTSAWVRQVPLLLPLTIPLFAVFSNQQAIELTSILAILVLIGTYALSARIANAAVKRAFRIWLIYLLLMTLAYMFFIQVPWFHQRYAAPIGMAFSFLILAILIPPLLSLRSGKWLAIAGASAVAFGFAILVLRGSYMWILRGEEAVPEDGFYQASEYIGQNLPAEARVGVFSAGLMGYYSKQPVIPLDGKVNQNAKRALEESRMFTYICEADIEYIADWEKMVNSLLIRRSQEWNDDNLKLLHIMEVENYNDIMIYEVNREACDAFPGG
ncbi:MAG: hypothetical protein GTO18_14895 [Anaerolineales bacterium]|nr:hypothetical protein [Anaerolineales bacterium]